jgi:alpha/beta superfamily hydrolase
MRIKRLRFPGGQDYSLGAQLDLPDDEPPSAYALFAHCFTCTKNLKAVGNINRALTQRGIAVLRFDFTGLGESEGDFADTNFSSNVEDLIAAADFLGLHYAPPKILIGHSLGGAAVMQAAHHIPSCVAVVTIAAPRDLGHLGRVLVSTKAEVERQGEAEVVLGGRKFKIKKQLFDDLEQNNMQQVIANLNRALLILHSPRDQTVEIENAYQIFTMAPQPKSFVSLDQADHLLMDERDSAYVGAMIATWASKYL